jgi:putative hydrolase of the HAD superfamily
VGFTKPEAQIYQITLDRLGVSPQDAVFVDDFVENVEAARQLGLHTVHFKQHAQVVAEINKILDGG